MIYGIVQTLLFFFACFLYMDGHTSPFLGVLFGMTSLAYVEMFYDGENDES